MKNKMMKKAIPVLLTTLLLTLLCVLGTASVIAAETCTHPSVDAMGLCTNCQTQMIASVTADGTTSYYDELADAFTSANGKTATVNQLSDYTFPLNNTTAQFEYGALLESGDVTWNLNGYDIAFGNGTYNSGKSYYTGVKITTGAKLTVNAEGSTWTATEYGHCHYAFYNSGAELTVNKGTFTVYDTAFAVVSSGSTTINDTVASSIGNSTVYVFRGKVVLSNVNISSGGTYAVALAGLGISSIGYGSYGPIYVMKSNLDSYYTGDFRKLMPDGASITKIDGTPLNDSDLQEATLSGNDGVFSPAIVVGGCTHDGETYVDASSLEEQHAIHCALCRNKLRTEACSGGTATCSSFAACAICSKPYGGLNSEKHESDAYAYIPCDIGSHNKVHVCCNLAVEVESCTFEGDICTACGVANLGEDFAAAEAELTAAVNEKIERVNARTDIEDAVKGSIVAQYEGMREQMMMKIITATTAEELVNIKKRCLCALDISEARLDLSLATEGNREHLTDADIAYLTYIDMQISQMMQPIQETADPNVLDMLRTVIHAMTDYTEDCIDLFVHINTLPNINELMPDTDAVKFDLFGMDYEEIYVNIDCIAFGIGTYNAIDLTNAIIYGSNQIWKQAIDQIEANLNETTYDAVMAVNSAIRSNLRESINIETATVADLEIFFENAKTRLEYALIKIESVNITLGESINVNYYIPKTDGIVPQIRFTVNGYTKTVSGVEEGDMLKFVFDGVAPQWIGDTITAELIIGGEVVEVKEYSVLKYLNTLKSKTAAELGISESKYSAMQTLIADLLVYGGAAQNYTGHNTGALVSEGIIGSTFEEIVQSDKIRQNGSYVTFTGATVFFDSVNALKFKFTATDINGIVIKVKVNDGTETEIFYVANGDGTYTITTDAIYAHGFDDVYTVTAYKDGVADASITYSVKSYVYAKQYSTGKIAELVKATYNYGLAAKAYKDAQ